MRKLTVLMLFLIISLLAFAQTKQNVSSKTPVPQLKKLLTGTGLPFKMINDSLYVVPYEGANIASYDVIIQKASDLFIIYTNLTDISPGKIDESKYKYLLQQNDHFDIIKIGISSEDKTVYVRADLFRSVTNMALLKRVIMQVANVTNIMAGEL